MPFTPPERFNLADHLLDARLREGKGNRPALLTDTGTLTYRDVHLLANRFANLLQESGVEPEQRVIIALPDSPEYVGALFGILKIGAVVVMVNPQLKADAISYFYEYTRARLAIVHKDTAPAFKDAAKSARHLKKLLEIGDPDVTTALSRAPESYETFPSHRDDAAIWLFSGGTTGQPKAVVQTHRSFANTTECYGKGIIGYTERDITLSVPKLYFGYATGSNLFFPFSVGAASALFPEACTADVVFQRVARFRPTVLINVPTMINHMVSHPDAARQDLSCIRACTSAGEALPVELYQRWKSLFGVELLDGLGTAEMWHIFISNRPGAVRPGTIGQVVPGFEVQVRDDEGRDVPPGEVGALWVRGDSRAIGYWQQMDKTRDAFRGEWYVSGDLVSRDQDGYLSYCGRADDMLKVGGKWLSPQEVEGCLLQHPAVKEAAVVGVATTDGLIKPHAFVVARHETATLGEELKAFVRERLEAYKAPREIVFLESLPRTHLGKVDRGRLRRD
jgi:benzoate-CoA ligase family protein